MLTHVDLRMRRCRLGYCMQLSKFMQKFLYVQYVQYVHVVDTSPFPYVPGKTSTKGVFSHPSFYHDEYLDHQIVLKPQPLFITLTAANARNDAR